MDLIPVYLGKRKTNHQERDENHRQGGDECEARGVLGAHLVESTDDDQRDNCPQAGAANGKKRLLMRRFIVLDLNVIAVVMGLDGGVLLAAETEIVEGIHRAERGGDGVVGEKKQGTNHGENLAATFGGGIDSAAIGIDAADVGISPSHPQ